MIFDYHKLETDVLKWIHKREDFVLYMDSQWYLVQCKPRESFRAAIHLQNQGYECFHPTHLVKRKIAGSVKYVQAPLFPYYLFVELNQLSNSAPIRSTRGVLKMVHFNGIPARLNDDVIAALRQYCDKLNNISQEPIYKIGDRVIIMDGCFKDLEAVVTATYVEERVTLLLNFFNRPQYVDVSYNAVASCE